MTNAYAHANTVNLNTTFYQYFYYSILQWNQIFSNILFFKWKIKTCQIFYPNVLLSNKELVANLGKFFNLLMNAIRVIYGVFNHFRSQLFWMKFPSIFYQTKPLILKQFLDWKEVQESLIYNVIIQVWFEYQKILFNFCFKLEQFERRN